MSRGQVAALSQRGVWVPFWILEELGAGTPAVFFAQLLFLTRGDLDAEVIRSDPEWTLDTGLTSDQAFRARKKLEDIGWLTCEIHKRDDGTPVPHLKVAWGKLDDRLREIAKSEVAKSRSGRRELAESSSPLTIEKENPPVVPPKGDRRRRGTPIAEPFIVDDPMRAWAQETIPWLDIDKATPMFIDYWRSVGKTKVDWPATWRNWMRKEAIAGEPTEGPRRAPELHDDCVLCDNSGWLITDNEAAVRCSCRAAVNA